MNKIEYDLRSLKAALQAVRAFTDKDDARPYLSTIRVESIEGRARLIATDGVSLCVLESVGRVSGLPPGPRHLTPADVDRTLLALSHAIKAKLTFALIDLDSASQDGYFPVWEHVVPAAWKGGMAVCVAPVVAFNAAFLGRLESVQKACGAHGVSIQPPNTPHGPMLITAAGAYWSARVVFMPISTGTLKEREAYTASHTAARAALGLALSETPSSDEADLVREILI
jgi:hypothetical protein